MLAQLLGPLNVVLFRLGNDQVTAAELSGRDGGGERVAGRARPDQQLPGGDREQRLLPGAWPLAAQFLLNAKRIENWAFWIAADLIYVPLYMVKRLDLTALVYVLFLGLRGAGMSGWRKALRAGHEASVPAAAVKVGGA